MKNISFGRKISIVGLGSIITLLLLLFFESFFAQVLTNTLIGNISNNLMLMIIIFGLLFFTIVIAIIVGFSITKEISIISVLYSSGLSLIGVLLILIVVPFFSLFFLHKEVFNDIYGFEIFTTIPQMIILFSILVLGDVFNLFIFINITYFVIFIVFLEKLYKERKRIY